MQLLLMWAIRFTEDFADDILAAHADYLDLHEKNPENRRRPGARQAVAHRPGELAAKVSAYLQDLRDRAEPLPGKRDETGSRVIDWRHLSRIIGLQLHGAHQHRADDQGIRAPGRRRHPAGRSGHGHDRRAAVARPAGSATTRPPSWPGCCPLPASWSSPTSAAFVRGRFSTCGRGCVERDDVNDLWLMRGLHYKGVKDKDGSKLPEGEIRRDPWVVIETVARAISVLERLHPHQLLFPTRIEPYHLLSGRTYKRTGNARTDGSITEDLTAFTAWVNDSCRQLSRADAMPDDEHGSLHASRFRRTLAWFIRRRPGGLVAASIQYGHLHPRCSRATRGPTSRGSPTTTPSRTGCSAWRTRRGPAGPPVRRARQRPRRRDLPAAGHCGRRRVRRARAHQPRQARDLLGNPLLQVHHGDGMTCVFNPATAACQFRGAHDDPQVTPDEDDCRPRCPNLARTDRDAIVIRRRVSELRRSSPTR